MSFEVPVSYIRQFSSDVHDLVEQRMSRLIGTVDTESVNGESFAIERIGSVEGQLIADLHGDTPLNSTPHSRRWGYIKGYDIADLLDKESQLKLLIQPMSRYQRKHSSYMGRAMDSEILRALENSASAGKNGENSVALPGSQEFSATGTSGTITTDDLIRAQEILHQAEADVSMGITCVLSAAGFRQLLQLEEIRNSDYNTSKALAMGRVDGFMGFNFVRTELVPGRGTTATKGYFYTRDAVTMGIASAPSSYVDFRPDKRRTQQVYTDMFIGAVRVEEELVVEMTYDGTPIAPSP